VKHNLYLQYLDSEDTEKENYPGNFFIEATENVNPHSFPVSLQ